MAALAAAAGEVGRQLRPQGCHGTAAGAAVMVVVWVPAEELAQWAATLAVAAAVVAVVASALWRMAGGPAVVAAQPKVPRVAAVVLLVPVVAALTV